MADDFLDRSDELRSLERAWQDPGSLLALSVGPAPDRQDEAPRPVRRGQAGRLLRGYGAVVGCRAQSVLGGGPVVPFQPAGADLLAHGDFPSWEVALSYLASKAGRERLVVVLDEFPYLVDAEPALPSVVQRFWDQQGRVSKLHLILCGSAQAVMEELQSSGAPLFGRVDLRLQLRPFGYREAALFTPRLAPSEQVICYAVLGGMPTYLQRWNDGVGHEANLRRLFAVPTSPLVEEGEFVLSSELPEGSGYFRILLAIAAGNRTYGTIKRFADIDIQRQLDRLLSIGLIERQVPVTADPSRTKQVVYRIADNFLAFWFRFVYRHRADIARGLGSEIVRRVILPGLGDYLGEPWEELCRGARPPTRGDGRPADVGLERGPLVVDRRFDGDRHRWPEWEDRRAGRVGEVVPLGRACRARSPPSIGRGPPQPSTQRDAGALR